MKSFLKQIDESFKSLEEKEAKPDFLDLDGDGDKKEPMKQAAKQKLRKAAGKSVFGKGDLDFKVCEKCSGKLTPHVKDECQRCAKNEAVDQNKDGKHDFKDVRIARMLASGEYVKCEKCNGKGCDHCDDMGLHKINNEASTTASMGAVPQTPYVFSKADDKTIEALGYKRVHEAMDKKYERLIEGYREFALSDSKKSPARKVNESIREVAKQLKRIEETINYTNRLKTESGLSHSGFSSGTHNALRKISERLIKISERVRSLGE
jgi:hypothetical protein